MSIFKTTITDQKKIERLYLLSRYHINTPDYLVIPQHSNMVDAKKAFISFSSSCDKVSIRTQLDSAFNDFKTPKWINIDVKTAERIFPSLIDSYTVLFSKAINPTEAIKVCAIAILEDKVIVELAYGGGTVERITRSGMIDKRFIEEYNTIKNIDDEDILSLLFELIRIPFINVIYEVSFFPYPIGRLGAKYVIWDITKWS